jgi:integrase/recombinase XerD
MKALVRRDADLLDAFLRQQRFRNRTSTRVYACIVRGFLHFAREHGGGDPPTILLVKQWLDDRMLHWPLELVCHRARVIDRFLQWMDRGCAVASNPFNQLRQLYGRRSAPMVRALVSDDPRELQRLRPPAPYVSFFGPLMREHVERMRSLGYRYQSTECILLRFDRFLQSRADLVGAPVCTLLDAWRRTDPRPQHQQVVCAVGRLVSKAMRRFDPTAVVLPFDGDASRRARRLHRRPYIYTEAQIRQLLEVAQSFESSRAPLRALSLYTMILLTYCAGLRVGELARLTLADVDLKNDLIEIHGTKFFKSRLLPLAAGVSAALKNYLVARRKIGGSIEPTSGLLWREPRGGAYSCGGIRNLITAALRRAGLKPVRGKVGPRIHDLRHAMVCNRMEAWYRDGINPQSRLPYLATYLGHKDINSTLVYLTVTQKLMQHASERFRASGVTVLRSDGERL